LSIANLFTASVLDALGGQNNGVNSETTRGNSSCVALASDVQYRDNDSLSAGAVSELQSFLQSHGYLSSEPTGYFGDATFTAVKSFQIANDIEPTGYVGAITRAKIKEISCQ
jgi:peptidoglycan hydrolase-like protein with peptidoglycan-binding domain